MPVPTTRQLHPGAPVSIVLKQDQPTGREVQGLVADILTSGNHPRGIKVRLQDGRIGRVQRMVVGELGETSAEELRRDLEGQGVARRGGGGGRGARGGRFQSRYTDIRNDEPLEEPEAELDLMAFVKVKKGKGKGRGKKGRPEGEGEGDGEEAGSAGVPAETPTSSVVASCPVCGEFEGDEAAVAHHVEQHFADG